MPDGLGGFGLAAKIAMSVPKKKRNAWRDRRLKDGDEDETQMYIPPPGQRHAAGYMEPDESRDYLELLKQRQAQGLPPDPRDGDSPRGWSKPSGGGWGR